MPRIVRRVLSGLISFPFAVTLTTAQEVAPPPAPQVVTPGVALDRERLFSSLRFDDRQSPPQTAADLCPGCPARRVRMVFVTTTGINTIYNLVNRARGHGTAAVGPRTWASNLRHGLEWDDDPFLTNQFGHPYQGSHYFTAGRALGLTFWESAATTALGSAMWEYFGENNRASLNDIINTTLGGVALGEIFQRAAWLIRNPAATGGRRLRNEILAGLADPVGSAVRFASGDASRPGSRPAGYLPATRSALASTGVLWQGARAADIDGSAGPYAEMDLRYGDLRTGWSRTPFDAFTTRFRLGGGRWVSDVRLRGRLVGQPLGLGDSLHLSVAQTFDFVSNGAYDFGGQGVEVALGGARGVGDRLTVTLSGWGGLTLLGAVDSRVPASDPVESPRVREYDYGPGSTFGGGIVLSHDGRDLLRLTYQGYQLHVVDGFPANHVMQRAQADVHVPLGRTLAVGVSTEYFYRKATFEPAGVRRDQFRQLRLFLTRTMSAVAEEAGPVAPVPRQADARSRLWLMGGAGFASTRAGCQTCPEAGVYRRTGGLIGNGGLRLTPQIDAGAEIAWVPAYVENSEPVRATFVLGVAQFRPWQQRGFFLKGGMGLGLLRNWIPNPAVPGQTMRFRSEALALGYGTGWIVRPDRRISLQLHATHHVAALGDLATAGTTIQNVVGNFWMLGAGVVWR